MKKIIFFTIILINYLNCSAQWNNKAFINITTNMGLSHGDVLCIYQDYIGYIWIGTADGLNKYDGIEFTVYKHNKKDSTSLSNSYIICIYEDKQKNLWIGTLSGLCKYNRDKNNFERIPFIDIHNNKFETSVTEMFEDNRNRFWIGCGDGVYLFDRAYKRFTACFEDTIGTGNLVYCSGICQDKNEMLWFSFKDVKSFGILKYNALTHTTTRYGTQGPEYKLKENSVYSLMIDKQNNIWIGYVSSGIDVINEQNKTITSYQKNHDKYSLSSNSIFTISENTDNKILIGTNGGGLNIFDPATKIFSHYSTSESERSLLSNTIQKLYVDRDGIVWIGCRASGVSIYDKRFNRFALYRHEKQDNNSLYGNSVTGFTQDLNGNIWIATDGGGINFFNTSEKKFINYRNDIKNPQSLTNDKVLAIETDEKGGLWAGMWQGGLNYFKIDGNKLILQKKYKYVNEADLNSISVFNIYNNKNGELWVGNFKTGAYLLDPKNEKFLPIKFKDITGKTISSSIVIIDILCDYKNDIWFATQGKGLIRLNRKTWKNEQFIHNAKDSSGLLGNAINVIYEDSRKRLWFGTDGDGLGLFNRPDKTFTYYTTEQGLPSNTIVGILEDSQGNLWISSNNGISKASVKSDNGKIKIVFRNYDIQDGLQNNIFNRWSYFKSNTREMYFGGIDGFNVFNPDSIKDNNFKPTVQITDFLLYNKPVIIGAKNSPLKKHISQTKELILKYNQSFFTFHYVTLNYIFSEKNQYAYIMEGLDKDWNYVGNKRDATYTNLEPGKYIFRVKASNNDNIWNEEGTSINIIILPPWWKTWWFKVLIFIVAAFTILSIYFNRIRSFRNRQKVLEGMVHERTKELEDTNVFLEEKQEEINLQKEELETQKNSLQEANDILTEQQKKIVEQNKELDKHRNKLELLITERTQELEDAKKKAEESDKLKSAFLANMSHEIRTPMNSIIGFSNILRDEEIQKDEKESFIDIIVRSGESLLVLIDDILDLSKIQAGQLVLTYKPILLDVMLNELYETFLLETKKHNLELILRQEPISNNFWIETEAIRLKQVFSNLISNSIKYTEEGCVEFGIAEKQADKIIFYVKDTGMGISSDIGNTIFESFSKIENNRAKIFGGAGLGLAISKSLVNLMGGKIWYESKLNVGTTFFFSIPLINADNKKKQILKTKNQLVQIPDLSRKTILVAEDEENNYKLIATYLNKTKASVMWARNGLEVVELFQQNPNIDLVIMDIKMPKMDGVEANRQIKSLRRDIKVIALTAFAYENDIKEFLASGFDASLTKPIKMNELMSVLEQFLI